MKIKVNEFLFKVENKISVDEFY